MRASCRVEPVLVDKNDNRRGVPSAVELVIDHNAPSDGEQEHGQEDADAGFTLRTAKDGAPGRIRTCDPRFRKCLRGIGAKWTNGGLEWTNGPVVNTCVRFCPSRARVEHDLSGLEVGANVALSWHVL